MFRTIIWAIAFVGYLIYSLIPMVQVILLRKLGKNDLADAIVESQPRKWGRFFVRLSGATITVEGARNIPASGGILFVANHQSNFDILILLGFVPRIRAFIAKEELNKVPIMSTWMHYMGCVFLARGNPREAVKMVGQAAENLKQGLPMVIFPEGTRSRDGKLGEFKPGGLKIAFKANVPVVPITIDGSIRVMPKDTIRIEPSQIVISVGKPIYPDEFANLDTNLLTDRIKNEISAQLKSA